MTLYIYNNEIYPDIDLLTSMPEFNKKTLVTTTVSDDVDINDLQIVDGAVTEISVNEKAIRLRNDNIRRYKITHTHFLNNGEIERADKLKDELSSCLNEDRTLIVPPPVKTVLTMSVIEIINLSKNKKLSELYNSYNNYFHAPVTVNGVSFYSGNKALNEYKELYDLGTALGLVEGEAISADGVWVHITKSELENVITNIGLRKAKGRKKLSYYQDAVKKATTVKEIDLIVWEDAYSGNSNIAS